MMESKVGKNEVGTNPRGWNVIIHEHRSGLVAELKEDEEGELTISECFRNMHGTTANLVLQAARQEIVIDRVTIYGTVRVIKEIDKARLLELHIGFIYNYLNLTFKTCTCYHAYQQILYSYISMMESKVAMH